MRKQQRMAVLGLLAIGLRYGWQMERFAEATQMRRWTPLGLSTIYKLLKDLAREGAVDTVREPESQGPARAAYALTPAGREAFEAAVAEALRSDASVYSDRMAGLVFAPAMTRREALLAIDDADGWLARADDALAHSETEQAGDAVAEAILGFYREVHAAERRALARVRASLTT